MKTRKLKNDLTGQTFGFLKVLRRSEDVGNGRKPVVKFVCECKCGKTIHVKSDSLLSGHTVSCGCKKVKHGFSHKERLYQTWLNMRLRCNNPNRLDFARYGDRGVKICDEWQDYSKFREWSLSHGYADNLSIDRIDVNGNYEPSNCRWVDNYIQANNTRKNHLITFEGKTYTMAELARKLGVSYAALQHRVERGWTIDRIVNTPQRSW